MAIACFMFLKLKNTLALLSIKNSLSNKKQFFNRLSILDIIFFSISNLLGFILFSTCISRVFYEHMSEF